jgi:hypothetical protein
MLPRPSKHEICKKIADALDAVTNERLQTGPQKHISDDLDALAIDTGELVRTLITLLNEIKDADPIQCYAGSRPPQRSYEPEIEGLELWAYSWHSPRFGKRMYLKFALENKCYIYVDCHIDRPRERD